jgi:hypothetical protein
MATFQKQFKEFTMTRYGREIHYEPARNTEDLDNALHIEYPRLDDINERYTQAMRDFLADEANKRLAGLPLIDTSTAEETIVSNPLSIGLLQG